MKKALLTLAAVAISATAFAQGTADNGSLIFRNRNLTGPTGAAYDVPIWADNDAVGLGSVGAGTLPGGVTVGLFTADGATLLASSKLFVPPGPGQFFGTPTATTVLIPGTVPGQSGVNLMIRAWQGASFAEASTTPLQQSAQWNAVSGTLGGTPPTPPGALPITPGPLANFGGALPDGSGLEMTITPIPEPSTVALAALGLGALLLRRRK